MKKSLLLTIAMTLVIAMPIAAKPVITFSNVAYNFGQIYETGGRVTAHFIFQNDGNEDLVITDVTATCGCVTPEWDTKVIAPHTNGQIAATYNPNGRPGRFHKSIRVFSNASDEPIVLYVEGEVIEVTYPCEKEARDTETTYGSWSYAEGNTPEQAKYQAVRAAAQNLTYKVFPETAQANKVTTETSTTRSRELVIESTATEEQIQFIYNRCELQCYEIRKNANGLYGAYVAVSIPINAARNF